jgi:hypothetical protein
LSVTTGAIIGVASRGISCTLDYGHVYEQPTAFKQLFDDAFAYAGGAPIEEVRTRFVTAGCSTSPEIPSNGIWLAILFLLRRFTSR